MNYKFLIPIILVITTTVSGCHKSATGIEEEKGRILLSSENFHERSLGVSALLKLQTSGIGLNKKIIHTAMETLDKEMETRKTFEEKEKKEGKNINQVIYDFDKEYPPEAYASYLENLVTSIARSRAREGVPLVFKFLLQGGYVFNDAIFTNFGSPAFDFLIDKVDNSSVEEQELAMSLLALWINPPLDSDHIDAKSIPPLSEKQKSEAKSVFLKGFENPNVEIKYYTIRGLGAFLDRAEIRSKLSDLVRQGETEEIRLQAKRILQNVAK